MNSYSTEFLARERIGTMLNEARGDRLARSTGREEAGLEMPLRRRWFHAIARSLKSSLNAVRRHAVPAITPER